jgi:hypothetical protein
MDSSFFSHKYSGGDKVFICGGPEHPEHEGPEHTGNEGMGRSEEGSSDGDDDVLSLFGSDD